jgi:hypothetical protein
MSYPMEKLNFLDDREAWLFTPFRRSDRRSQRLQSGFSPPAFPGKLQTVGSLFPAPKTEQVAGIWDHGKLSVGDAPKGFKRVFRVEPSHLRHGPPYPL